MIREIHNLDDVDFDSFCDHSIAAMEVSGIKWPDHYSSHEQKKSSLRDRMNEFINKENGLAFVVDEWSEEVMIGAGYWEGKTFHLVLTFYTEIGSVSATSIESLSEWMRWLAELGAESVVSPVPNPRVEGTKRLFNVDEDETYTTNGVTYITLWHKSKANSPLTL